MGRAFSPEPSDIIDPNQFKLPAKDEPVVMSHRD